ncbi:MAG: hypothetical protein VXB01_13640, partial [Opitutae bacterium]
MDPAEVATITTDALLPRNYPGIYYLSVEINALDSINPADINKPNDRLVSSTTARINLQPTNSPYTYHISQTPNSGFASEYSEFPTISGDGSRVAFVSMASDLVAGDSNGLSDIFVRDRNTNTTVLVSKNSTGELANRDSFSPAISANGVYVAYTSTASNLVDGDSSGFRDVFVHNVDTSETVRISKRLFRQDDVLYVLDADGSSFAPSISEDGRFVAFASFAKNLDDSYIGQFPSGGVGVSYVYLHDRCVDGDFNRLDEPENVKTYLVSTTSDGRLPNTSSSSPSISLDGHWVAFQSRASNLLDGLQDNIFSQIYRRQLISFADATEKTTLAKSPHDFHSSIEILSIDADGNPGSNDSYNPSVNGNGDHIAFVSEATHFDERMNDTNGVPDVFVHSYYDLDQDPLGIKETSQIRRLSISSGGNEAIDEDGDGNTAAGSLMPSIDRSGRYVAFRSHADNITHIPQLINGFSDVFLHDRDFDGNGTFDEVLVSGVRTEV